MRQFTLLVRKEMARQGFKILGRTKRASGHISFIYEVFNHEGRILVSSSPKNMTGAMKSIRKQLETIKDNLKKGRPPAG